MRLFGKLLSKKNDPEFDRAMRSIQSLVQAQVELRNPKDRKPLDLYDSAKKGLEARHWLFELTEKFEAAKNRCPFFFNDTVEEKASAFIDHELIEWIEKQTGVPEPKIILDEMLGLFRPRESSMSRMYEDLPRIVASYHAKPNKENVLLEKANLLAQYVVLDLQIALDLYCALFEDDPKLSDDQREIVQVEEAAVWFAAIDRMAHWFLRRERQLFMDYFEDRFGYQLALRVASPDTIDDIFTKRLVEYGSCPEDWFSKPDEPSAGFLLWEAGKHLIEALGCNYDAFFILQFGIFFGEKSLKQKLIFELLTGQKKTPNK